MKLSEKPTVARITGVPVSRRVAR